MPTQFGANIPQDRKVKTSKVLALAAALSKILTEHMYGSQNDLNPDKTAH